MQDFKGAVSSILGKISLSSKKNKKKYNNSFVGSSLINFGKVLFFIFLQIF
jgi:hypothetical protein